MAWGPEQFSTLPTFSRFNKNSINKMLILRQLLQPHVSLLPPGKESLLPFQGGERKLNSSSLIWRMLQPKLEYHSGTQSKIQVKCRNAFSVLGKNRQQTVILFFLQARFFFSSPLILSFKIILPDKTLRMYSDQGCCHNRFILSIKTVAWNHTF